MANAYLSTCKNMLLAVIILGIVFWLIAALIMMGIWAGMAIMMTGLRTYLSLRTYSALQLHSQAG